jgi:ABC-type molybdate transport system substrate-binding protein
MILYASMLEAFCAAGTAVPLPAPADQNDRIVFGAGAIVRDGYCHPAAERFVTFLVGSSGQAVLTQAGFLLRSHALPAIA